MTPSWISTYLTSVKEPSTQLVLGVPALICAAMVGVGIVTATISGISGAGLVLPYMATAVAFTILAGLAFTFIEFGKLALVRADRPVPIVVRKLCSRFPLLILPTILFPLLLAGYTTAKTAIPFVVGYRWEKILGRRGQASLW